MRADNPSPPAPGIDVPATFNAATNFAEPTQDAARARTGEGKSRDPLVLRLAAHAVEILTPRFIRVRRENRAALKAADQLLAHFVNALTEGKPVDARQAIANVTLALKPITDRVPGKPELAANLCGSCLLHTHPELSQDKLKALLVGLAPLVKGSTDPVIHQLKFTARAELLRRQTEALEARGTVFGGRAQRPVEELPEEDLRALRGLWELASHLVETANAHGKRQDAVLPGTRFTLNQLERIQAYALHASDALRVMEAQAARIRAAEKNTLEALVGPVDAFDAGALTDAKLIVFKTEIGELTQRQPAVVAVEQAIQAEIALRKAEAKAEFETSLQAALRETDAGKAADKLLRSAVKAQTAMSEFAQLDERLTETELAQWVIGVIQKVPALHVASLKRVQESLINGEGKAIRDSLSASGIHRVSQAIDYLGMLSDALNAQCPVPRLPSAPTVKGVGGLTPAAVSALRHHLHVESQTASPVGLVDLAPDIATARFELAQARRDGVDGAGPAQARNLMGQMALMLSVTVDPEELAGLKDITESLMRSFTNKEGEAPRDLKEMAALVDTALTQAQPA